MKLAAIIFTFLFSGQLLAMDAPTFASREKLQKEMSLLVKKILAVQEKKDHLDYHLQFLDHQMTKKEITEAENEVAALKEQIKIWEGQTQVIQKKLTGQCPFETGL